MLLANANRVRSFGPGYRRVDANTEKNARIVTFAQRKLRCDTEKGRKKNAMTNMPGLCRKVDNSDDSNYGVKKMTTRLSHHR